jgi:hypothetical protein
MDKKIIIGLKETNIHEHEDEDHDDEEEDFEVSKNSE